MADLIRQVEVINGDADRDAAGVLEEQLQLLHQRALAGALRRADSHHQGRRPRAAARLLLVCLQLAAAPKEDGQVVPEDAQPAAGSLQGLSSEGEKLDEGRDP